MKKLFLLSALSLLSTTIFADSECRKSYERGQRVFTYSNYELKSGTIIKQRSNENYVIKKDSENSSNNAYQTNIEKNSIYTASGCASNSQNENTAFNIGDTAYLYLYSNYEYELINVKIEAFNYDSSVFIYSQVRDEELASDTVLTYGTGNVDQLFSKYMCSTATDDHVEICPGDTAISLDYSVDVQIIGLRDDTAFVSYGETLYTVNISNLIKVESNSSIEP